jgi:hypothetical protein
LIFNNMSDYTSVSKMPEDELLAKTASIVTDGKKELDTSLESARTEIRLIIALLTSHASLSQRDTAQAMSQASLKKALSSAEAVLRTIDTAQKSAQATADETCLLRFNRNYTVGEAAKSMHEVNEKIAEQRAQARKTFSCPSDSDEEVERSLVARLEEDQKTLPGVLRNRVFREVAARGDPNGMDGRGFCTALRYVRFTATRDDTVVQLGPTFAKDGVYLGLPHSD